MENLQDKLNIKLPTDKIYISTTLSKNNKEYINYFLMSSDGSKLMQLTGEKAGEQYETRYRGMFQYDAGEFSIWSDATLDKELHLIKKIKYSSLLKYWKQRNKELSKKAEKQNKKYSQKQSLKQKDKSSVDEFFK